jgi:DUF917 family protein
MAKQTATEITTGKKLKTKVAKAKKTVALEPYADEKTDAVYGGIANVITNPATPESTRNALIRVANQHAKLGNRVAVKRDRATEQLKKQLAKLQERAAKSGVDVGSLLAK